MKIFLPILGLFLAVFFSSQVPTTSALFYPSPSRLFCRYFPSFILCSNNNDDSNGSNSGGSTESSASNSTTPTPSASAATTPTNR
ncbi:phosphatidylinositol 3-kinase 2 isoform X2 [Drosophila eugracilis]|uniref:phosphatidylinositol 3-kinase 2 isoform X2 n=1 Tax=Drosophila eugracilis TaxID=29029 RepID=UPI0007E7D21B|nr:phosphatidylinositol 3-kinase 2 isoform X2 [Drosophila eugracilis]